MSFLTFDLRFWNQTWQSGGGGKKRRGREGVTWLVILFTSFFFRLCNCVYACGSERCFLWIYAHLFFLFGIGGRYLNFAIRHAKGGRYSFAGLSIGDGYPLELRFKDRQLGGGHPGPSVLVVPLFPFTIPRGKGYWGCVLWRGSGRGLSSLLKMLLRMTIGGIVVDVDVVVVIIIIIFQLLKEGDRCFFLVLFPFIFILFRPILLSKTGERGCGGCSCCQCCVGDR